MKLGLSQLLKKVSIIMGVYNCEDILGRSLESVLAQSYSNWEFIICDDGSTDNTYKVLKSYSDLDDRVKIVRNVENLGLAASLNKCLKLSSGEYIARQDADDLSLPDRLSKQVEFLELNHDFDFVGTKVIYFDNFGDWGKSNTIQCPEKEDLVYGPPFCHPSVMFRARCLNDIGGYRVSKMTYRSQDYDLWFRLYSKGYKGYNLDEPLFKYRLDRYSYSKRKFKYRFNELKIRYYGFKSLNFPFWKYIYIFKPIVVGLIPKKIVSIYHKQKFSKNL